MGKQYCEKKLIQFDSTKDTSINISKVQDKYKKILKNETDIVRNSSPCLGNMRLQLIKLFYSNRKQILKKFGIPQTKSLQTQNKKKHAKKVIFQSLFFKNTSTYMKNRKVLNQILSNPVNLFMLAFGKNINRQLQTSEASEKYNMSYAFDKTLYLIQNLWYRLRVSRFKGVNDIQPQIQGDKNKKKIHI